MVLKIECSSCSLTSSTIYSYFWNRLALLVQLEDLVEMVSLEARDLKVKPEPLASLEAQAKMDARVDLAAPDLQVPLVP